jgi:hypothetical protein
MKKRHNKKRNTAFLYETLIVELTKAMVYNDQKRKQEISIVIKESFGRDQVLSKELQVYKSITETNELDPYTAEKLIFECKNDYNKLNKRQIFNEQSKLINLINRKLSKNVYSNFVPGYRTLATISQIFNDDISTKHRVLLEKELLRQLTAGQSSTGQSIVATDDLTYQTFVKKFNDKYGETLNEFQKKLLNNYIASFSNNDLELKVFLNEELGRISDKLSASLKEEDIRWDPAMVESTKKVLAIVENFKTNDIESEEIEKILKIQKLVEEIES